MRFSKEMHNKSKRLVVSSKQRLKISKAQRK